MADLLDTVDGQLAPAQPEAEGPAPTIFELLRKRHPPGEWAFLEEVAQRPIGGRFADGVAINLWSSRGYAIHGFEVKVSRGDWLRELKQPEKAEPIFRYCNYWYLVAEKDVVKPGELPDTWGHLERRGRALYVVKAAPKLKPAPVSLEFFASLIRRAHEQLNRLADCRFQQALADARAGIDKTVDERVKYALRDNARLQQHVAKFEAATGLTLDPYGGPPIKTIKLAQRLQALQGWKDDGALGHLVQLAGQLEQAAATVRQAITETGLTEQQSESQA